MEKGLTQTEALRAYARMLNTLDVGHLEPHLADGFHYASQWVFEEITSKEEYLTYIPGKLQAIKASGARCWAEMAELPGGRLCVVVAQKSRNELVGTVLAEVENGKIKRIDFCMIPTPQSATRSGEYPV